MRTLRALWMRVRAIVIGRRLDADAAEEVRFHLEQQTRANLRQGMAPDEARRAAGLDVGQTVQLVESSRDARGLMWWDALRLDLRYAFRQVRKRPGFSAAVILTIAVAVGAAAAVFAVVNAVLLRPLPYPDSKQLYAVFEFNTRGNVARTRLSPLNFVDIRNQAAAFDGMAAHVGTGYTLTGNADPLFTLGQVVTTNLFDVLQTQPFLGRVFRPDESEAGRSRVVILSYGLWQEYFGNDRSIVGRTTTINGEPYLVAGVMPAGFHYPEDRYRLWTPLVTTGVAPGAPPFNRSSRYLNVIARLRAGVAASAAADELARIGQRLSTENPNENATVTIRTARLSDDIVGDSAHNLVLVLVAVGVVLLAGCVNAAGLAIARGSARTRELSVRAAIGANRSRIVRQLATEALVLYGIGGAAGLGLAALIVTLLSRDLVVAIPRAGEASLDWTVVLFVAAVTMLSGFVFSILPALTVSRTADTSELSAHGRVLSPSRRTKRARDFLIVTQVATAIVLLFGSALALRSFARVIGADKGFEPPHVMTFGLTVQQKAYPTAADLIAFTNRLNESVRTVPRATSVGITTALPLSRQNIENAFTVDGAPVSPGAAPPIAGVRGVTAGYRAAVGSRLQQGRDFQESDNAQSQPVVIVTDNFVRRYVTAANPIGVRIRMGLGESGDPWRTIVGVIADVRHVRMDDAPRPEVWMPYSQLPAGFMTTWSRGLYVAIRAPGDPAALLPALRDAVRRVDPVMPLIKPQPLDELASESVAERRLETSTLTAFGAVAVTLAGIGLFGVLAFFVTQHFKEFGVRLALGSTPRQLLQLVMRRALTLLAIGLAIGIPAALAIGRVMATMLFDVSPTDAGALVGALVTLSVVTLLASALPAYRAMRTDPLTALRGD